MPFLFSSPSPGWRLFFLRISFVLGVRIEDEFSPLSTPYERRVHTLFPPSHTRRAVRKPLLVITTVKNFLSFFFLLSNGISADDTRRSFFSNPTCRQRNVLFPPPLFSGPPVLKHSLRRKGTFPPRYISLLFPFTHEVPSTFFPTASWLTRGNTSNSLPSPRNRFP